MEKKIRTVSTVSAKSFSVNLDEVELPSGRKTTRIKVNHPDASAMIAFVDNDHILMVKQYRYAIGEVTLEIPAGKIDQGETPLECAKRELFEETGYKADNYEFILKYYPAIGYSSEILYIYKVTGLKLEKNSNLDNDEINEFIIMPVEEVIDLIKQGKIVDGKTIIGLAMSYFKNLR